MEHVWVALQVVKHVQIPQHAHHVLLNTLPSQEDVVHAHKDVLNAHLLLQQDTHAQHAKMIII